MVCLARLLWSRSSLVPNSLWIKKGKRFFWNIYFLQYKIYGEESKRLKKFQYVGIRLKQILNNNNNNIAMHNTTMNINNSIASKTKIILSYIKNLTLKIDRYQ